MIAFISTARRSIDSPLGKRTLSVELTDDFKRVVANLRPLDLSVFLFICLSANEFGSSSIQPAEIASKMSMEVDTIEEAMKRLSRQRLESKKLIFIGRVGQGPSPLFQVVMPTDEQCDEYRAKKIREYQ